MILTAVAQAVDSLFVKNVAYYCTGIGCLDLIDACFEQQDLFMPSSDNIALMTCLDSINNRYGRNTLTFAAQGGVQRWAMRREFLSPQYTTRWSDIPKIDC